MKEISKALGMALLVGGLYLLAKDIVFFTHSWGGIAALSSVLALVVGVLLLVFGPKEQKSLGWVAIAVGVVLLIAGSRAHVNSVSLWQFLVAFGCMAGGYKLLTADS